jgi:hypothetical protein
VVGQDLVQFAVARTEVRVTLQLKPAQVLRTELRIRFPTDFLSLSSGFIPRGHEGSARVPAGESMRRTEAGPTYKIQAFKRNCLPAAKIDSEVQLSQVMPFAS